MQIFETSILEIIAQPLRIFYANVREPSIYEHLYGPLVIVQVLRHLPPFYAWLGFGVVVLFHLVLKELIYDVHKNGNLDWQNVIERSLGVLIGILGML